MATAVPQYEVVYYATELVRNTFCRAADGLHLKFMNQMNDFYQQNPQLIQNMMSAFMSGKCGNIKPQE